MTSQEPSRGEGDQSQPAFSPSIWEKMREHVQDVAQQIAQNVQHAIMDGQSHDREIEPRRS